MSGAALLLCIVGLAAFLFYAAPRRKARSEDSAPEANGLPLDGDAMLALVVANHQAGGVTLQPEHWLAAALFDPRVAALARQRGLEVAEAQGNLLSIAELAQVEAVYLFPLPFGAEHACISQRMLDWFDRARERAIERKTAAVSVGDLVRTMHGMDGPCRETAAALGDDLAALDAERAVDLEREPAADPYRAQAGEVDVYAVNDEKTTMETVVQVLTEAFDLDHGRAVYVMYETHGRGAGFVARLLRDEARERVDRAVALARESLAPLELRIVEAR